MLTHFSLFTGIGGMDLASEWAGFTTVGQCEWADYPTKVLEKHWPNVPRWRDVRDVTADSFRERTGLATVDLISGGYPCQPFSMAGDRRGSDDDRYLWPQMLRVITEVRPTWVLGENVAGHITLGLDDTLADLDRNNYTCRTFVIPARGVGAPHGRYRTFIVAHTNSSRELQQERFIEELWRRIGNCGEKISNTNGVGLQRREETGNIGESRTTTYEQFAGHDSSGRGWDVEPDVGRVADGVPSRMDRLKCLGNAVVPQQVYPILKAIAEIENGTVSE